MHYIGRSEYYSFRIFFNHGKYMFHFSLLDDLTGFPFPVEELFLSHNNLETLSNLTFYK